MNKIKSDKSSNSFWSNLTKTNSSETEIQELLKSIPICKDVASKYIKLLPKLVHHRQYQKNEVIFLEGDPGIGFYVIQNGNVQISQKNKLGKERILTTLSVGDFFGEIALLDSQKRSATAKAISDSSIVAVFKPDLDDFMDQHPRAGVSILRNISLIVAQRLSKLNDEYLNLSESIMEE